MDINVDFSEVGSPTAKQIDLVQEICRTLHVDKPPYTFEDYSKFISEYIEDFKDIKWAEQNLGEYFKFRGGF